MLQTNIRLIRTCNLLEIARVCSCRLCGACICVCIVWLDSGGHYLLFLSCCICGDSNPVCSLYK